MACDTIEQIDVFIQLLTDAKEDKTPSQLCAITRKINLLTCKKDKLIARMAKTTKATIPNAVKDPYRQQRIQAEAARDPYRQQRIQAAADMKQRIRDSEPEEAKARRMMIEKHKQAAKKEDKERLRYYHVQTTRMALQ